MQLGAFFVSSRARGFVSMAFALSALATSAPAQTTRLSVAPDGSPATGGPSSEPVVSGDGRYVVFSSSASNLVPGDTNNQPDVFVRDLVRDETTRVSVASDGTQGNGPSGAVFQPYDISADGRFVAFVSGASNLVPGDTLQCHVGTPRFPFIRNCYDAFVHDRQTGETTRVSVSSTGVPSGFDVEYLALSGDGRQVLFSPAAPLLPAGTPGAHLAIHDRATRLTTGALAGVPNVDLQVTVFGPFTMSEDARFVTFHSSTYAQAGLAVACSYSGCNDLFLLDRQAGRVELVSVGLDGQLGNAASWGAGRLSQDGRFVAFISEATNLARTETGFVCNNAVSPPPTEFTQNCPDLFVRDRLTGRTSVINVGLDGRVSNRYTGGHAISRDGRYVSFTSAAGHLVPGDTNLQSDVFLHDRHTGALARLGLGPLGVEGDGGVAYTDLVEVPGQPLRVVFDSFSTNLAPNDTDGGYDIFIDSADADGDGMLDGWERIVGLDPSTADGGSDADGDGVTNAAEFASASHPRGASARYLAEGADNAFFSTRLALFNPAPTATTAVLRFLTSSGEQASVVRRLEPRARLTVDLADVDLPAPDFATVVESGTPVVVDRTMTWNRAGFGSHSETAITAPGTEWWLAEGATHGPFDLFYLLQNPGTSPAQVTITCLRPAPFPPVVLTRQVAPLSRLTVWVDTADVRLAATDVSAVIQSTVPILVERAMYLSTAQAPFDGGIAGAAVARPATRWFLAEGATGTFFDLYLLLANPSTEATRVRVTYLLPDGAPVVREYDVARESRLTISVDTEDPRLAGTAVSSIVESLTGTGIVVERSMWWPGQGRWREGHLSAGATATGLRWALAEGEVGGAASTETYVLIANTSAVAGTATLTIAIEGGSAETQTVALPPNSRVNVPMSAYASTRGRRFGVLVESDGPEIVVERAMYANANGETWAAGTAALATRLP